MKTFRKSRQWAMGMAVIFLLGILFVAVNPASAAQGSEKTGGKSAAAGAAGTLSGGQVGGQHGKSDPQGPPENPGPGCYKKIPGKGDKTIYKYFKNGHPDNPSDWEYVGPSCEPYGG